MMEAMSVYPAPGEKQIEKMFLEEMNEKYPDFNNDILIKVIIHEELDDFGWENLGSWTGWQIETKRLLKNRVIGRIENILKKK